VLHFSTSTPQPAPLHNTASVVSQAKQRAQHYHADADRGLYHDQSISAGPTLHSNAYKFYESTAAGGAQFLRT
jgi:hypothetical protein